MNEFPFLSYSTVFLISKLVVRFQSDLYGILDISVCKQRTNCRFVLSCAIVSQFVNRFQYLRQHLHLLLSRRNCEIFSKNKGNLVLNKEQKLSLNRTREFGFKKTRIGIENKNVRKPQQKSLKRRTN